MEHFEATRIFEAPKLLQPQDHGCVEQDRKLEFLWFERDQSPVLVNDVIIQRTSGAVDINEIGIHTYK